MSQHWIIWSAGFFPDKMWSISPRCKKHLEFYVLTKSVNRPQNERDNIRCKKFFLKNEIDSSRVILALQLLRIVRSFSFCCFLTFISNRRSAFTVICGEKRSLSISTLLINYQQLVIAVYISYGSRPSPHCVFMFHGCITSWDVKYLLWHVPVTLILLINRCNFLFLLWRIAGKCDQSAGCRRQPAAILNPDIVERTFDRWNIFNSTSYIVL